jgi:hypothetical protein
MLILSCALSQVAVQQRLVAGPDVQLRVGAYWLVAYTTKRPDCPPYGGRKPVGGLPCSTDSLFPGNEVYVIWLVRSAQPGDRREIPQQLFALSLH